VVSALDSKYKVEAGSTSTDQVYGSFSRDTTNRAFIACAIAILAIIAYLTIRFEIKFAIPAIVALFHDVGLTLGIYAATGRVVTSATVAAILTILGYSVHDTIIVYDRMRENTLLMKKETYGEMVEPVHQHQHRDTLAVGVDPHLRRPDAQGLRLRAHHRRAYRDLLVLLRGVASGGAVEIA
jgi:preprotein translocase SecF subunit